MPTRVKIKIKDDVKLRADIDEIYEEMSQIIVAKWSIIIAKHILKIADIDYKSISEIVEGFKINELWQIQKARMHDVRQIALKIHKLARDSDEEIQRTALRVVGQALSTGHMKEHAMVASDYAVKTIGLISSNSMDAITFEREWQLNELKKS